MSAYKGLKFGSFLVTVDCNDFNGIKTYLIVAGAGVTRACLGSRLGQAYKIHIVMLLFRVFVFMLSRIYFVPQKRNRFSDEEKGGRQL